MNGLIAQVEEPSLWALEWLPRLPQRLVEQWLASFGAPEWLHSQQVVRRIRECWEGAGRVCAWLDAHVGPSTEPPDDRPF